MVRILPAIGRSLFPSVVLSGAGIVSSYLLHSEPPAELLADQATRLLPPRVFALVLDALQYWGKPVLLMGLSASWLIFGAALATIVEVTTRRSGNARRASFALPLSVAAGVVVAAMGLAVIPALAGAGILGARSNTGAGGYSTSVILSTLAFTIALYYLVKPVVVPGEQIGAGAPDGRRTFGRREFLMWTATAGFAVAGAFVLSRTAVKLLSNAQAVALQLAGFVVPEVTPVKDFYVVSKNFSNPRVDAAEWNLEVTGEVENPLHLSFDAVRSLPSVQQYVTLECVSNEVGGGLISNTRWTGVRMKEVLGAAGLKNSATHILTTSDDGYTESMPIDSALADEVILAYEMDGESLTVDHGYPVRLLLPGHYGMKSTKWLKRLEAATRDRAGYWEKRGWREEASVKTMTRIDVPQDGAGLPPGPVPIAGVAFSGARGISRVEISTDGGKTWVAADLKPGLSPFTWVHWRHSWLPAQSGRYKIAARAFDREGVPQIAEASDPFPSGATGYHTIGLEIIE